MIHSSLQGTPSEWRQHLVCQTNVGNLADILQLLNELWNRLHRVPMCLLQDINLCPTDSRIGEWGLHPRKSSR